MNIEYVYLLVLAFVSWVGGFVTFVVGKLQNQGKMFLVRCGASKFWTTPSLHLTELDLTKQHRASSLTNSVNWMSKLSLCIFYIYTSNSFHNTYHTKKFSSRSFKRVTSISCCDGLKERGCGICTYQPRIQEDKEQWQGEKYCWGCSPFCNCSFHKSYPIPKGGMEKGCRYPRFHP